MAMGYFAAITIATIGILRRSSLMTAVLICLYMWGLIGLNICSPDYETYNNIYISIHSLKDMFEPGFAILNIFCLDVLKLDFTCFRMVCAFIIVMFIYLTAHTYTCNVNFVLILYFIMPFILFISGIRAAIALSAASYFFKYLIALDIRYSLLKYIVGILFAASFHYCALFYLFLPICRFPIKALIAVFIVCSFGVIILFREGIIYSLISQIPFIPERVQRWFIYGTLNEYTKPKILIIMFSLQCLMLLCMEIIRINLFPVLCRTALRLTNVRLTNAGVAVWVRVNYLVLVAVPFSYLMTGFSRLFYGILLTDYAIITVAAFSLQRIHIIRGLSFSRNVFIFLFILFILTLFIFYICILHMHTVFFPSLLYQNTLFS